jgi:hypothetical protein
VCVPPPRVSPDARTKAKLGFKLHPHNHRRALSLSRKIKVPANVIIDDATNQTDNEDRYLHIAVVERDAAERLVRLL